MSKQDLTEAFVSNFNTFESQLNGQTSLPVHKLRKEAINTFSQLGVPGPKNEEYKYTNMVRALGSFDFHNLPSVGDVSKTDVEGFALEALDAHHLVFVNGQLSKDLSTVDGTHGLVIKDLATAFEEDGDMIGAYFAQYADYKKDAFTALNTAFAQNGSFIHVAENVKVDKPIALCFINDASAGQAYNNVRNLFVIGQGSEVIFVEDFNTKGENESLANTVTEIVVSENAKVDYYKIQNNKDSAYHIGTTQVYQTRASRFSAYTFTLNGAVIRNNLNITVDAENCESHLYGLYLLNGKTHVDNHTEVDHREPNCESNELYKGILEDKAHGVFNGKVYVRQKAQKTNAFQSNKNILLSDSAIVNSKPQLEIWADDVKCSHGCTTGQIDEEALFYLRSRGLSEEKARALLLYAFAIEVIEQVKLPTLREYLENLVSERLQKEF